MAGVRNTLSLQNGSQTGVQEGMAAVTIILLFSLGSLSLLYWYKKSRLTVFKRLGIEGPTPDVISGNLSELKNKPLFKCLQDWTKQYGKVYGYYEGPSPIMVTTDLEIIKQIFIKQFSTFHARKIYPLQPDCDDESSHMFFANGERWRRLRAIIIPSFTTLKMKQMSPLINQCVDSLMEKMEENRLEDQPFDIYGLFQRLTLDVIGECAFGFRAEAQTDPNDPLLKRCRQIFLDGAQRPFLIISAMLVPELHKFWEFLHKVASHIREDPFKWLSTTLGTVMEDRKRTEFRRVDLLQLMLDAEEAAPGLLDRLQQLTMTSETRNGTVKHIENGHINNNISEHTLKNGEKNGLTNGHAHTNGTTTKCEVKKPEKRALSTEEIKAQATLFLLAGYETSSTCLAYAAYELALNPEVQKTLQEEVLSVCGDKDIPTFETIQNMPYLDMVTSEVLRMYPLASAIVNRLCTQDCTVNGVHIPKDIVVQPDIWTIHYDQSYWGPVDTKKFYPERFLPENKQSRPSLAYMPFGAGPRNCVGMRFGLMEVKLAVARIVQKYNIEQCAETQVPLTFMEGGTVTPRDGVNIRLSVREVASSS